MLEAFLPLVAKPARYINTEINSVHKDLAAVRTKVCLFFPDTYEVGMSHLGLRILYHILNARQDTAWGRGFLPCAGHEGRHPRREPRSPCGVHRRLLHRRGGRSGAGNRGAPAAP